MSSDAGAISDDLTEALSRFASASDSLIADRQLQQRFERKFLIPSTELAALLKDLASSYEIMHAGDLLLAEYESHYLDTPSLALHTDHGRGRRPRFKVRVRYHHSRELAFLEVKRKGPDNRTTKYRMERTFLASALDDDAERFIEEHAPLRAAELRPAVATRFSRVTVVGREHEERITVDLDLRARAEEREERFTRLAIVEVKQARVDNRTAAIALLRRRGLRELSFSKYGVSVCRLLPTARRQLFADQLRAVEKVSS
jgi:hypothetical protein